MYELAQPWLLVLILVAPFLWFVLPREPISLSVALKVPFFDALQTRIDKGKLGRDRLGNIKIFFAIWLLLVLAVAGPQWVGSPVPLERKGRNIMMVLDLSGSMELNDMLQDGQPASRLAIVKKAAKDFVQARIGDRIGLILFGSQAYLQTPLTFDRQSVMLRIDDASVGLAGKTTSIGDALGLAVKRLQSVPLKSRVIILLTDGANNSGVLAPLKAAELAAGDDIKVYTIGLGAEVDPHAISQALYGFNTQSDLDEDTLQTIAKMTGGRYFRATDTESLQAIYGTINTLETVSQEETQVRPRKEYYPWPLTIAFLLLLYWFYEKTGGLGLFVSLLSRQEPQS